MDNKKLWRWWPVFGANLLWDSLATVAYIKHYLSAPQFLILSFVPLFYPLINILRLELFCIALTVAERLARRHYFLLAGWVAKFAMVIGWDVWNEAERKEKEDAP